MITIPVKILDIRSFEPMVMLSVNTASKLKLRHTEIVTLRNGNAEIVASPVVVQGIIEDNRVGISERDANRLKAKDGSEITITARRPPLSYELIKKKISGKPWTLNEVNTIVNDISRHRLTNMEIATFTLVSQFQGFDNNELVNMARSMAEAGTQFNFKEPVYDKHSIGGIPGNKITPIIVSIVAASGLLIPKTSSRAITSPTGTADTMEVMCDVKFTPDEITELAPKVRGMIVWNAPLNLSPLDDIVIGVKSQLGIDPQDQMLASIVSTKLAMGVDHLIFDIPTGADTKMPTRQDALNFAHSIIGLCRQLGIRVEAALTLGEQPLGLKIGPALEAQEALSTLEGNGPNSVLEKSVELAGIILEMAGLTNPGYGSDMAGEILASGKALKKFQEIVETQGGEMGITSDKIIIGDYKHPVKASKDGYIVKIDNKVVGMVCRAAGAPKDKKAGIEIHAKIGEFVHQGDKIFTIYSSSETKLSSAIQISNSQKPFQIEGMVIRRIGSIPEKNV